jgi:hypothetical protein
MRKRLSVLAALAVIVAAVAVPSAAHAALSTNLSQVINQGTLSVDFVDGSNVSIASPSVSFGAVNFSFACQPATATLGTASQKLQVKNPKKAGVKIDLNTPVPATDKWTSGGNNYKYNDATGTGCTNGQLAVSGGSFTKTIGANTPTYTMPGGAFTGASSVTLFNNTSNTAYDGDITNYTLTQQIPAEQTDGTYSLPMVVSYVAQ